MAPPRLIISGQLPLHVPEDLREYISWLEERGELRRVGEELSPVLEIPALLRQVMRLKGPALLFNNVSGHPGWRVVGNIFRGLGEVAEYLGVEKLEELGERLVAPIKRPPPLGAFTRLKGAGDVLRFSSYLPRKTGKPRFMENELGPEDSPLNVLPAFKTWPLDGGRYLTYPIVVTRDPETGVHTLGVYRMMILDGARAVIHWQIHKRGAWYAERWGRRMPVAVAIGCSVPVLLAAAAPVPHPLDKYLFAGVLGGEGVKVYEIDGLEVPACAEALLVGHVDPEEKVEEGPFGDHFGFYDKPREKYPVFHVERMYYRDDPIYYGTVVGKPPLEDAVLGRVYERVFLPVIKLLLPEIEDMYFPEHGVFQGMLIVSIKKRYPGHAKKVMSALWGLGQTSLTKIIVVVDASIDPHSLGEVIWAVSSYVDPQRDVVVMEHSHTDVLDPAAPSPGYGSKLGIDATKKLPEEYGAEPPLEVAEDPEVLKKVQRVLGRVMGREG